MMLSAGGAASCLSFHLPRRGFAACEESSVHAAARTTVNARVRDAVRIGLRIQSSAMRKVAILLFACLALPSSAFATWSVIAVDRSTGRVVIASATCVNQGDDFLKD